MSSSVNTILDAGQTLAGATKSHVDLSIRTDATDLDRQAAVYGYLGALSAISQVLLDTFNQPGFASLARNLGGAAALAGMGVSVQQFQEVKAAWDADPSTTNLNAVLEKAAGLSANIGGVIAVLPGGQGIGGDIWLGGSLLENHYNGNFAAVGGMAVNVAVDIGVLLKPLQTQPNVPGVTWSPSGTYENNRTPAENVAAGLSPDGYALNTWTALRLTDGTEIIGTKIYTTKVGDSYQTYQITGEFALGNLQQTFKTQNSSGQLNFIEFSSQSVPGGPLLVKTRLDISSSGKLTLSATSDLNAVTGLGTPTRNSATYITSNDAHSITVGIGGTVSDIWLLQKNAGNVFTLEEFGRAILISNPGITDINAVQAGQVIYVPRRQTDGSVTYNYGGGASINTNATTGEYHMVVPNNSADGGFTIYQRSVDGDAGYVVRQTVTRLDGEITFATVGFQPTKDADITNLSTFTLNGTGSYDAATAVNGSLVAFEAEYNSARESFRASEIKSINDAAVDAATSGLDPTDLETFGFVFDKPLTASAQALLTGLDPATQATTGAPVPKVQITPLADGQTWRSLEVAGGSTFSTLRDDEGNVISATYSRELGAGVKLSEVYDGANTLLYTEKIEPVLTGANAGQLKETLIRPDGSGFVFQRGADGQEIADTRVRVAPYDQRLASTFSDVPSFIDAIKSGKPLPIVANGLRLLNDLDQLYTPGGSLPQLGTANTVAAGALSLYNLNNALKHGDAFDKLSATAFALNGTTNALIAAGVISKTGAAANLLGAGSSLASALPYLGLISSIKAGDPIGMAQSIGLLVNPAFLSTPLGWALIGVQILRSFMDKGPPDAWGTANVTFGPGITNYLSQINATGENFGPDRVRGQLQSTLDALNSIIAQTNSTNPDSNQHLGIIPQRLPSLNYRASEFADKGYSVTDIDALSGAQRFHNIRFDDSGQVFNLDPNSITPELRAMLSLTGAPNYPQLNAYMLNSALDRQAIAPLWEVKTAKMQDSAHTTACRVAPEIVAACAQHMRARGRFGLKTTVSDNDGVEQVAACRMQAANQDFWRKFA